MSRRAKIVCTLGPATYSEAAIRGLVDAGMDVARLNLSHGTHADHEQVYWMVRAAAADSGRAVGIMVDLQGPKIRLGRLASGPVTLVAGAEFTITTDNVPGNKVLASTTYAGLPGDVEPGLQILIDDGRVCLEVVAVDGPRVVTIVIEGGTISDHKGINVPGAALSVPAMSDKDIEDLRWGLRIGADLIALSFVRSADDFAAVARIMDEEGTRVPVIAKIEKPQAVDHLDEIVEAFDGFMIARGDLGVEMPLEQVPIVQKRARAIARFCTIGTCSSGISTPRSPRAIMKPSNASTISSRWSTACGFSILAMTGTRVPSSSMILATAAKSSADRTNDKAIRSAPIRRPQRRSSTSLSLIAGTDNAAPGTLMPLWSEIVPPSITMVTTRGPSTATTSRQTRPSSMRICKPGSTSPGSPA